MFRLSTICILLVAVFIPTAHAVDIPTDFTFNGSGYGHGVGLSQIGAKSMAILGKSSSDILQYYYKDVAIETKDDSKIVRVNIGHLLTSAKISTATKGGRIQLFAGDIGDQSDATPLSVIDSKSFFGFELINSTPKILVGKSAIDIGTSKVFTIRWTGTRYFQGVDSLVSVVQAGSIQKYKYGQMQIKVVRVGKNYRFELTNSLRLADEYLWGVSEMPSYWPVAALEAQAIASRSYALSKVGIIRAACDCDLYGQNTDQVFLGFAKESEKKFGPIWKKAVSSTTGLTLTQSGLPITAYFFSSSGGKTETAANAWGSARTYTQTVDDPGSLDKTLNPNYVSWQRTVQQNIVATAFLLPDVVSLEILGRNESGTVSQIRATSSEGVQATLKGETFRSRTKIPSAWIELVSVQYGVKPTPSASATNCFKCAGE
jgi:SpoIID/LytB domain protein